MRRALIAIGLTFLFVLPSVGAEAAPRLEWTRQVPGWVMAVDTSSNGVTAAVGSRWAPGDHQTMSIVVYGPRGGQRWQGTWRPAGESAFASDVAIASDGSIYVGGHRTLTGVYESETWWFLRRYAANGTLMWHRDQLPAQHPRTWGSINAISVRGAGIIVAGDDTGCCDVSAGQDGWVRAFGGNGGLLWTNRFEPPGIPSSTQDLVWDLAVYRGAIYAAGQVAIGTRDEPWRDLEAVVARLAPDGSLAWAKVFRDPGIQDDWDAAMSITVGAGRPVAAIQMNATTSAWTRFVGLRPETGALRWSAGPMGGRRWSGERPPTRCSSSPVTRRSTRFVSSDHAEGCAGPQVTSGSGSPTSASPVGGCRWLETTRPEVRLASGGTSSADDVKEVDRGAGADQEVGRGLCIS